MKRPAFFLAIVLSCGAAVAASVARLSFSPEDPEALVLVEERDGLRGGTMTFVQVDLTAMTRGKVELEVDKTTRGRLRTSDPGLQTKGEGLLVPKNMSRFSAAKGAAGDYALVDFSWYDGVSARRDSPSRKTPVFRFVAGKANLVTAEMLPAGGSSSNILPYAAARNGSNDDVADAQKILGEHAALRGTVVLAELVGWVRLEGKKVVLVESGN